MNRLLLILFTAIFGFSSTLFGQEEGDTSAPAKKTPSYFIEGGVSANYGSTNLSNEFIQKLLFGGRIEEREKDKVLDKTNKRNRFGVELNYDLKFVDMKDTLFKKLPDFAYYLGFGSYNNVSASYTKDLFSTVFYGNKQFENETAKLGRSNFVSQKFEKITFGLVARDFSTSIGVSLIIGDRYDQVLLRKADMFTHPEGTSIDIDYNGKMAFADRENRSSFMGFSGTGIGFDYMTLLANRKYTFSITNLGFIVWARNPRYSNTEINYNFDGIEIDNILQTSNEEFRTKAEEIVPGLSSNPFVTLLPTIFRFDKNFNKKETFQTIYGVRYKMLSNYLPSVYGGGSYQINTRMRVAGSLAWGGYAGLRAQAGFYYRYKKIYAGVESTNLTGIFLKSGNGNGANLFFMTYF
mgnify:CR=1 FL=1